MNYIILQKLELVPGRFLVGKKHFIKYRYAARKGQALMQFIYSKHIPLVEEMIAKAQEKVIQTNPKDTFNMGFHAIPSMAQVKNQSTYL